jgi:hypothetical protein
MPRLLRRDLPEFDVRTVQEEHWLGLKNGALLRAAQDRFEVFVTVDKRLQHQQNLASFRIAVVIVSARSTRLVHMRDVVPQLRQAIAEAQPGNVIVVAAG